MTRMTGPDCVVMCNLINTYIHTYIQDNGGFLLDIILYFQNAHFIPIIVGVGKRGAY